METILAVVNQDPIYGIIGALLVIFLIVSLLKQLLFVAICFMVVIAGFTFYLQSTGEEVSEKTETFKERLVDTTKDTTEKWGEKIKETTSSATENIQDSLRKKINEGTTEVAKDAAQKASKALKGVATETSTHLKDESAKLKKALSQGATNLENQQGPRD